ncbi:MAG: site-2 protease family protein [Actinobacteria bacterium]|nr:site-2 protease family protein [Actinomycetota bacterium]MCB8998206.1 site-2 protease family protein [Actinomycetota bacterium]MCB9415181.1 site-2 protease family protein [Actinomycetota bacterium]MCB9425075.1 site-2 protease family protein [Actinomycetota bacterium]
MTLVGIIALVIALVISIALHELGHMVPAKKFGVKVTQYMIGFGPTLWSKKKGDTEYGVKGFLLGGYIRMIGMFPPGPDGQIKANSTGRLGTLIEQARAESAAEIVEPGDEKRTFYALPVRQKLVVMLGGPFMNLVLAVVLFTIVFAGFGTPTPTTTVNTVTACVPSAQDPEGTCAGGTGQPTGAAAAGLQPGDQIVAWDAAPVSQWPELSQAIRASAPGDHEVTIVRDGQQTTVDVPLTAVDGTLLGESGQRGFLGVSPVVELQPMPVTAVPGQMWDISIRSAQALVSFPAKMVGLTQAAFTDAARDPEGPVGVVGVSRLSGEVAAADAPPSWRVAQFLAIVASLNLFLFLFNLLPILPLDGGHVAGALYEGARRKVARWQGRPDPGPVDVARMLPVAYTVAMVLIVMSVIILWADIVKPIRLG